MLKYRNSSKWTWSGSVFAGGLNVWISQHPGQHTAARVGPRRDHPSPTGNLVWVTYGNFGNWNFRKRIL